MGKFLGAAALAAALVAAPVTVPATPGSSIVAVGIGDATACQNHVAYIVGERVSGNTWSFIFTTHTTGSGGCVPAGGGVVTGTWAPVAGGGRYCVVPTPGVTPVGFVCLAHVPVSTTGTPTSDVSFSVGGLSTVNGVADAVRA